MINSISTNRKQLVGSGFKINGSIFSKNLDLEVNDKKRHGFKSLKPKKTYNLDTISKDRKKSEGFKRDDRTSLKIESSYFDKSSYNDNNNKNTNVNSTNSKLKKKIKSMHSVVVEKNIVKL